WSVPGEELRDFDLSVDRADGSARAVPLRRSGTVAGAARVSARGGSALVRYRVGSGDPDRADGDAACDRAVQLPLSLLDDGAAARPPQRQRMQLAAGRLARLRHDQ